jgi:cytochrome c553
MNRSIFSGFVLLSLLFIISCDKDDTKVDCTGVNAKYTNDIESIMTASCSFVGCHDSGTKSSGVDLSTYEATVAATKSDKFLKSIKHESGASKMPKGGDKLSDATIKRIECWASNGTPR